MIEITLIKTATTVQFSLKGSSRPNGPTMTAACSSELAALLLPHQLDYLKFWRPRRSTGTYCNHGLVDGCSLPTSAPRATCRSESGKASPSSAEGLAEGCHRGPTIRSRCMSLQDTITPETTEKEAISLFVQLLLSHQTTLSPSFHAISVSHRDAEFEHWTESQRGE